MKSLQINIVNYGVGNTHSVENVFKFLGYKVKISGDHHVLKNADVLILPGVGAFEAAMKNLSASGLDMMLSEQVLVKKTPILGICLGMQLMASISEEHGSHVGLDWIKGKVEKLELISGFPVPHVGWNNIIPVIQRPLFSKADNTTNFYFDHSYYFKTDNEDEVSAYVEYGTKITAAVQKDNICGVQFHPEKSQTNGLKLFRSLINTVQEYA